ncbi:MAG TPA: CAP domain-containing protein [Thermoanaerobaculia bacterium]|nr:CAP domain-containing protein [Thermoanaerobaculia bacterium]
MKRKLLPLLLAAASLATQPALSQSGVAQVRQELMRLINAERSRAGSPPLHLDGALTRAAQQHAEEISRRGTLRSGSTEEMQKRLVQVGYHAHEWTENLTQSGSGLPDVLAYWKRRNPSTFQDLMDPRYRDIGLGISRLDGTPLYSFLFAIPQGDYFARETAGIRDRDAVSREMLAQVNAARKKAGLKPLRLDSTLAKSAQRHAEDMLSRGYFAHRSPSGATVRERARAAGYDWRAVGENIAFGQTSVDEVVTTWLGSPGHRKNILSPNYSELGVGLALGRGQDGKYQVLWVQNFGTPAS